MKLVLSWRGCCRFTNIISQENSNTTICVVPVLFSNKSQIWRDKIRACFHNYGAFPWDHTLIFCFLLCRIQELCPNRRGNSEPVTAFIRTECLPEALKYLGFPNQEKQTQHLMKQLLYCIHLRLCKKKKIGFAKLWWPVFQSQRYCSFHTVTFSFEFWGLQLLIIIITILKRLGPQIHPHGTAIVNWGTERSGGEPRSPESHFSAFTFSMCWWRGRKSICFP